VPKVCAGKPAAFAPGEIDDFVALVLAGGEVDSKPLKELVLKAQQIAFLREDNCLLGVGGLKNPTGTHRRDVQQKSNVPLDIDSVPFELGWVFILPSARGRKLSFPLCRILVAAANGSGIYATSGTGNAGMHSTLKKLGFVRSGSEWPSRLTDGTLALFLKPASSSALQRV
jgi:hypothetical protein